ncbi:drug transporter, putative [Photobacterium sp. SKA34]|uniref:MFS transporter n=1 Tax=Photobacterium sp. SKA34 TaxID=121723 RepID=UPI00006B40C6|nr:MFS transporter [Photobacterium sp. SKA34]EAR57484.1 drug transporter, putative [Photobacterium sp. SKA34]
MSYRYKIASVFLIGFFLDCINIFMSAIALPSIANTFNTGTANVAWVANSYILGMTLVIPMSTWLASRYSSRNVLSFSMALFGCSVFFCGLSTSLYQLIGWRFIQGVGGGLMIPVGQSLTFSLFQQKQRAKVSTFIMMVALIAPAISPTIGGLIVEHLSWHWVFFSSAPLSIIVSILAWYWVHNDNKADSERPDIKGLFLVSTALIALLVGMSIYSNSQYGIKAEVIGTFAIVAALILVGIYIEHDKNHHNPIINLSLFKNNNLTLSIIIYYAIPGVFTGINLLNIFFLQGVLHFSADKTGMFMILYGIGAFIAIIACGKTYNHIGPKKLFVISLLIHTAGVATLLWVHLGSPIYVIMLAYILMGLGGGLGANCAQTTALMDFDEHQMLKGSVIWNINRQISFCVGDAFFTMLFNLFCMSAHFKSIDAYHLTYLIAVLIGILTLIFIVKRQKVTL